jgi:hypothetical protein
VIEPLKPVRSYHHTHLPRAKVPQMQTLRIVPAPAEDPQARLPFPASIFESTPTDNAFGSS